MLDSMAQHLGTVAIGLIVAGVVAAIIVKIVRDKRRGKCAGCDCGGCPGQSSCGAKQ